MSSILRAVVALAALTAWPAAGQQPLVQEGVGMPALEAAIDAEEYKKITSVAVFHNNRMVYEHYWGEGGPEVLNDTRSATKSLTALAVGAAIMDGHIKDVNAPALQWFREEQPWRFPGKTKDGITIRDLLTMSSAFDCDDNVWESPGNEEHMHPARRWLYFVLDMPTRDDYKRDDAGLGPFYYCTAGVFLLGQIIERATGLPVDVYIARRILQPLGITEVEWPRSPSDEIQTGGGLTMRTRDLAKLGQLVLQRGYWRGRPLIDEAWIAEMLTGYRTANPQQKYGYLWWHRRFTNGNRSHAGWYMAGNGGNKVVVFQDLNAVVVVTSTNYRTAGMHQQTRDLIERHVLPILTLHREDEAESEAPAEAGAEAGAEADAQREEAASESDTAEP